tara:strand:- start:1607 stop:5842 length:4236 start_codon:yes stop_codon:yes gene_type:complete
MAIKLPANFESNIQGKDTNLVPVVVIGNWLNNGQIDIYLETPNDGKAIYLSTNSIHMNVFEEFFVNPPAPPTFDISNRHFKPLLLNIPSLKESINIEKRNYKISSVNLDISNFPYNGKRFSDLLESTSLINTECRIYWVSPSVEIIVPTDLKDLYLYNESTVWVDDSGYPMFDLNEIALEVYFGTIRRYDHDDEKVRLVVEDRSQATLHKDLPSENLGTTDDVPDKYKNKPIPMVYGHVDRSPCVLSPRDEGLAIIYDRVESGTKINNNVLYNSQFDEYNSGIYLNSDDIYIPVIKAIEDVISDDADILNIYNIGDVQIVIPENTNYAYFNPTNPFNNAGYIQCKLFHKPNLISYLTRYFNYENNLFNSSVYEEIIDNNYSNGQLLNIDAYTMLSDYGESTITNYISKIEINTIPKIDYANIKLKDIKINDLYLPNSSEKVYSSWSSPNISGSSLNDIFNFVTFWDGTPPTGNMDGENTNIDAPIHITVLHDHAEGYGVIHYFLNIIDCVVVNDLGLYTIRFGAKYQYDEMAAGGGSFDPSYSLSVNLTGNIHEIDVKTIIDIKQFHTKNFYANVMGREMTGINSPIAPIAIEHILNTELGQNLTVSYLYIGSYTNWQYAFTVNKKINSKKLIEGIASVSPYIPRFNNMGEFRFDTIPLSGGTIGSSDNHTIKESDVVDFSFSRTKIEDVYTKIIFKYNWDYARREFNDSVTSEIGDFDGLVNYEPEYYGFKMPDDGDYDHAESTLTIDDDRGKYIRESDNHNTAQEFANWYLLWSCNQHLKMKVKLPLKYMNLEIGDLVDFDAILGGVKPYGKSYIPNENSGDYTDPINDQTTYKNFLITSTNKTLEWVEIECVQMHNLEFDCASGCDGVCFSGLEIDECGDCGGDGATAECGCDDKPDGECDCDGNVMGDCGCGDNTSCLGCDGVANSGFVFDGCGVCGGGNNSCAGCQDPLAANSSPGIFASDTVYHNVVPSTQIYGMDIYELYAELNEGGNLIGFMLEDETSEKAKEEYYDQQWFHSSGEYGNTFTVVQPVYFDVLSYPQTSDWQIMTYSVKFKTLDGSPVTTNLFRNGSCPSSALNYDNEDIATNPIEGGVVVNDGGLDNWSWVNFLFIDPITDDVIIHENCSYESGIAEGGDCTALTDPQGNQLFPNDPTGCCLYLQEMDITSFTFDGVVHLSMDEDTQYFGADDWGDEGDNRKLYINRIELFATPGQYPIISAVYKGSYTDYSNSPSQSNEYYGNNPDGVLGTWDSALEGEFQTYDIDETTIDADGQLVTWENINLPIFSMRECLNPTNDDNVTDACDNDAPEYQKYHKFELTVGIDANATDTIMITVVKPMVYTGTGCSAGDLNGDGIWNVLDIVALANCVLASNCADSWNLDCAGDVNGDGTFTVLDMVALVNCILANNCGG